MMSPMANNPSRSEPERLIVRRAYGFHSADAARPRHAPCQPHRPHTAPRKHARSGSRLTHIAVRRAKTFTLVPGRPPPRPSRPVRRQFGSARDPANETSTGSRGGRAPVVWQVNRGAHRPSPDINPDRTSPPARRGVRDDSSRQFSNCPCNAPKRRTRKAYQDAATRSPHTIDIIRQAFVAAQPQTLAQHRDHHRNRHPNTLAEATPAAQSPYALEGSGRPATMRGRTLPPH